jgi:capsular polysaccharide biosynthesis protein
MRYPSFIRQALELRLGSNFDQRVILADNPVRVPNLLLLQTEVDAGFVPPVAIELLRNAYLPNHAKLPVGHRDIYISRRYAPSRAIANETELEDTLRERGFEIVYGEKLSFAEQVQLFSQARTVVALHGAGLSNMIWAPEKLKIIEIFPNDYFNDCYARLALQLKFDYDYLLCNLLQGTSASGMISVADVVVSLPVVSSQPQDVGVLSIV